MPRGVPVTLAQRGTTQSAALPGLVLAARLL